jgi:hypothetical protein
LLEGFGDFVRDLLGSDGAVGAVDFGQALAFRVAGSLLKEKGALDFLVL